MGSFLPSRGLSSHGGQCRWEHVCRCWRKRMHSQEGSCSAVILAAPVDPDQGRSPSDTARGRGSPCFRCSRRASDGARAGRPGPVPGLSLQDHGSAAFTGAQEGPPKDPPHPASLWPPRLTEGGTPDSWLPSGSCLCFTFEHLLFTGGGAQAERGVNAPGTWPALSTGENDLTMEF